MSEKDDLAYENMMRTSETRKLIMEHLHSCRVFENIMSTDPAQLSYNVGMRAGALRLMNKIKDACPHLYLKMIEEDTNG
jgi:hypothetical protein